MDDQLITISRSMLLETLFNAGMTLAPAGESMYQSTQRAFAFANGIMEALTGPASLPDVPPPIPYAPTPQDRLVPTPDASAYAVPPIQPKPPKPPGQKRVRRTKAQMEAERAAKALAEAQALIPYPTPPMLPQQPATPSPFATHGFVPQQVPLPLPPGVPTNPPPPPPLVVGTPATPPSHPFGARPE